MSIIKLIKLFSHVDESMATMNKVYSIKKLKFRSQSLMRLT